MAGTHPAVNPTTLMYCHELFQKPPNATATFIYANPEACEWLAAIKLRNAHAAVGVLPPRLEPSASQLPELDTRSFDSGYLW